MDPYFKKEISYSLQGNKYIFSVAETLFSTYEVDFGTDLLLRYIKTKSPKTILDLGCGYGVIGIVLAKTHPNSIVTMADRDLLAVYYGKINIEKNSIDNATCLASIGMDELKNEKYDLIVSNIPAKIGDGAIVEEFILTPCEHLNPGGELWIVIVNGLNRLIPKLKSKHNLKVTEIKKGNGHTVYTTEKK